MSKTPALKTSNALVCTAFSVSPSGGMYALVSYRFSQTSKKNGHSYEPIHIDTSVV